MRIKPKLVSQRPLTLHSNWLVSIVSEYFDLTVLEQGRSWDQQDCYYTGSWDAIAQQWANQGRKVVLDWLWEPLYRTQDHWHCHVLQNWNWFWYQESLWYKQLDYHNHVPNPNWTHHALMPMRRKKTARDYIIKYLSAELHRFVWSYQDNGYHLPNSGDPNDWNTQRLFRPEWYNATAMSLVIESRADSNNNTQPFLTEKTFKPMAFRHPFVVCGDAGSLKFLKSLGFETFDNLFDEHYDTVTAWVPRIHAAIDQCLQYHAQPYDQLTQQKLAHNHAHFFDQNLVRSRIQKEILEPLLAYAET